MDAGAWFDCPSFLKGTKRGWSIDDFACGQDSRAIVLADSQSVTLNCFIQERNEAMQWLMDQMSMAFAVFFVVVGLFWHLHGKRVKSFMKDNPVGQAATSAAKRKAISEIARWLK
jgi:hypothetical protein